MPDLIFNQYVHLAAENGFTVEERAVLREQEKNKQRALNPALSFPFRKTAVLAAASLIGGRGSVSI